MTQLELITRQVEGALIHQRALDGYVNATSMCSASGKLFADYARLKATGEFMDELARSMGIHIDRLVFTVKSGTNEARGTWVHPDVAINLGQWCSPRFAVAVAQWVREWHGSKGQQRANGSLPYHLRRYMANRAQVPHTHFSMLNEMALVLIGPLEDAGYSLPDKLLPDISEGRMFCKWLRDEKGIDTDALPTYRHEFEDGRIVFPKLYPNEVLADFRGHFHTIWLPKKAVKYFTEKDPAAITYLDRVLALPGY
ncbi:KilA-N domain-containing protein [Pseudomonas sp.]|uniref:KilA-N domain-containing protein n=1 Tax=Pseudomonas sp. TaxID=306 RepID=UPI0025796738|nr:KilA-N domain-containing protein [Pseudomonas sp.]